MTTTSPRPAFQLYSVRSHPDSLPDIVRRVAARGFEGVEFADRFQREPPDGVAAALDETGLVPVAVHADLSTIEDALAGESDLLERCATVGCDRLIVPHLDSTQFRTRGSVRELADRLTDVAAALDERELELGLHNDRSWLCPLLPGGVWRLIDATPTPDGVAAYLQEGGRRLRARDTGPVPRKTPFWHLIEETDSDAIRFELEVAELRAGGVEPTEALSLLDSRVKMLHLRDVAPGSGTDDYENVPHGDGVVDMKRILNAAGDADIEWAVYENELDTAPEEKNRRRQTVLRSGTRRAGRDDRAGSRHGSALSATESSRGIDGSDECGPTEPVTAGWDDESGKTVTRAGGDRIEGQLR